MPSSSDRSPSGGTVTLHSLVYFCPASPPSMIRAVTPPYKSSIHSRKWQLVQRLFFSPTSMIVQMSGKTARWNGFEINILRVGSRKGRSKEKMRGKKKTQKKRHAFDFWYELQTERGFHQGYKHKNQDDERQMRGNTHITAWWNKDYMHGKKKPNKYADQLHVKCFEQGQVAFRLSIPITIILCLKSQ